MSSSNYYQLYIESVLQLAETIVIKSQDSAEGLNRWVADYFGGDQVNPVDPTTWKYYRNLAGEYHFTDEVMTVVSLDTLEEITFSTETLQLHRATKRGYAYGTREYRQLVSRYPHQEMLILGILYPVDKARAIAAKDGTILGYPPNLVEANEYSLIANLQRWIDGYKLRWMNNQYGISDDLYPATALGIMYLNLVPAILNFRLQACKTNEAHSFHVRQYLASHGMLDQYMDHLTLKQALFLYRNIAYIERNSGQRNTFEWLVEHIMTERALPLAEYVMRHDLTHQPTEIYPTLSFTRNPLNPAQSSVGENAVTLPVLLQKEDKLALANPQERLDKQEQIQQQLENSPSNVVLTKALESSMIDYSNATPYTLEDILINHWLWLSSNGLYYQAVVAVTNPKTGERIPMMVKDAFVFAWYAFCASWGLRLETIPKLYAKRVQRIPTPSVDELMKVANAEVLPHSFAQQVRDWQPTLVPMISTEAFYNAGVEIYQAANWQRKLIARQEHTLRRAMAFGVVNQLYSDNICQLASEDYTYDAWFADRNIKIDDFSQDELGVAYLSITRDATGLALSTNTSVRNVQRAMVRLLGQLSSYSVQFMTEINSTDIRVSNEAATRVGDRLMLMKGKAKVHPLVVESLRLRAKPKRTAHYPVGGAGAGANRKVKLLGSSELVIEVKPRLPEGLGFITHFRMNSAPVYVSPVTSAGEPQGGVVPVMGVDIVHDLTREERSLFKDVWRVSWGEESPMSATDLKVVLYNSQLDGFDPPEAPPPPSPTIPEGQSISYPENSAVGINLGSVTVTNSVNATGFRFADTSSDTSPDGLFRISSTGAFSLTVVGAASAANDFEGAPNTHTYNLQVSDTQLAWSAAVSVEFVEINSSSDDAPVNTAAPTITGAVRPGQTLTASTGTWTANGAIAYAYQWKVDGGVIAGATAVTYQIPLNSTEVGKSITVQVIATANGISVPAESSAVEVQPLAAPVNTALPTIDGTATPGQLLTATTGVWTAEDVISYSYQWQADNVDIAGATAQTYLIPDDPNEAGKNISVVVTATVHASAASVESATVEVQPKAPVSYRYWRLVDIQTAGGYLEISELQMLSGDAVIQPVAVASSEVAPALPLTNWVDGNRNVTRAYIAEETVESADFWIRYDFGVPMIIDGVRQAAWNRVNGHMHAFTLQGSDNVAGPWTTVGSKSNLAYPRDFTMSNIYSFGEPVGDPLFANVELLLTGDGADNDTVIYDMSSKSRAVTRSGPVTTKSARTKFGNAGLDFALGGYLSVGAAADWSWMHQSGTQWTFETFASFDSFSINRTLFSTSGGSTGHQGIYCTVNTNRQVDIEIYRGVASTWFYNTLMTGVVPNDALQHHIVVQLDDTLASDQLKVWCDGVLLGQASRSASAGTGNATQSLRIGGYLSAGNMVGGMDEVRITRGIRYSETPPMPVQAYPATVNASPETDPYASYVQLLLHGEDADGSTVFTDSSGKNRVVNSSGTVAISTSQKLQGNASIGFANNGVLTVADSPDFNFQGDFTVEFDVFLNSLPAYTGLFVKRQLNSHFSPYYMYVDDAGRLWLDISTNGSSWNINLSTDVGTIAPATKYHIALVRSDNSQITVYVNGVVTLWTLYSSGVFVNTAPVVFGGGAADGFIPLDGSMDEIRVTNGKARYSMAFTPPSIPHANP